MNAATPNPYRSPDGSSGTRQRWLYLKMGGIGLLGTAIFHLLAWSILTASAVNFQIDELLPNHSAGSLLQRQPTLHLMVLPIACIVGGIAAWIWKRQSEVQE